MSIKDPLVRTRVHTYILTSSGLHPSPLATISLKLPQKKEDKAGAWKCFASVFVSLYFPRSGGGHRAVATVT